MRGRPFHSLSHRDIDRAREHHDQRELDRYLNAMEDRDDHECLREARDAYREAEQNDRWDAA